MAACVFLDPQRIKMTSDDKRAVKSCRVTLRLVLDMMVLDEIVQTGSRAFRQISEISGSGELPGS
jgi:hypothetical protein